MKQIILKLNENKSYKIIFTNSFLASVDRLYLMEDAFIAYCFYEEAVKGVDDFSLGGFDGMDIDQGSEFDDFYMAFVDSWLSKDYLIELDGEQVVDYNVMPKLKFTKENFDHVLKMTVQLRDEKSSYVIITLTNNGWVDLCGKNELSEQEKQMVREFEIESEKWKEEERERVLARQEQDKKN